MAVDRLNQYDNIGELHNVVEGLTITCKNEMVQPNHLPVSVRRSGLNGEIEKTSLLAFGLSAQEMEKKLLRPRCMACLNTLTRACGPPESVLNDMNVSHSQRSNHLAGSRPIARGAPL
jgi:DNA-binding NtrC family response regulator